MTDDGLQPIRDLSTQMSVWSRDADSGVMGWRPVQAHYANHYDATVSVEIRDLDRDALQTIVSNRIHPYFVQTTRTVARASEGHIYRGDIADGHWIDAADLQSGDRLLNDNGGWSEVVAVRVEDAPLTAYNLTVEGFSTYFVAANENAAPVWVRNTCLHGAGAPNGTLTQINTPIDLTNGRSGHILANHRAGAGKAGKTEFPSNWNDQRIIHQVSDISTDPSLARQIDNRGTPYVVGTRDGVEIRVNFFPNNHVRAGQIATACPTQ